MITVMNTDKGVKACSKWLSTKLEPPSFDVFQNDNVRKANEAQQCYVATNIMKILKDENYSEEYYAVLKSYDFDTFSNNSNVSWSDLVTSWSQDNSMIINIIISASKYNIMTLKKDEQDFVRSGLPEKEATGISELEAKVKAQQYEYTKSGGKLDSKSISKLTKIELFQEIAKCEEKKNKKDIHYLKFKK